MYLSTLQPSMINRISFSEAIKQCHKMTIVSFNHLKTHQIRSDLMSLIFK